MYPLLCCIIFFIALLDTNFVTSSPLYCSKYAGYCGNLLIEYPFSLSSDSFDLCGYPGLMINSCKEETPIINISNKPYHVTSIDKYKESIGKYQVLTVVGMDVLGHECPRPVTNITQMMISDDSYLSLVGENKMTIFYNCSAYPRNVSHIACLEFNSTKRSYAFNNYIEFPEFNWNGNCETSVVVPLIYEYYEKFYHFNDSNYNTALQLGFQLQSVDPDYCFDCEKSGGFCFDCEKSGGFCWFNQTTSHVGCKCGFVDGICHNGLTQGLKVLFGGLSGAGGLLLILLIVYRKRLSALKTPISRLRKTIQSPTNVEVFLESYGCLSLQRFSYSEVKNMTNSFQDILGQGGYGSVFKGKLSDGRLVAVKVLTESKGNGDEFINEVATIGRTNHVNVVALLGFCSNRSKRALVYEFMPNGSLERFIYNENKSSITGTHLGGETLYRIALGIAKGLEYLHSGCNTRILHFDIKPHNILLDENFCPKISDFGLAKLCATRESVVSMPAARGTIGYIAPEVCCRNFGGVSYKSDVYSYGMMLLEMIGGRKNVDATVVNTSEIYFPHWIYNRLEKERAVAGSEEVLKEETTKKMVLISLWCIQIQPTSRPSMTKVVDMLEGSIEDLEMPPNPFTDPPPTPSIDLPSTSLPSMS